MRKMNMHIPKWIYSWKIQLALITSIAVVIRSIPAWIYAGWGNDFGIYYSITIEFMNKLDPFVNYPSVWGSSGYGSFPMLYIIIIIAHYLTGLPVGTLLLKVPPIIGGLTVVPLYFISYELTKRRGLSLVAALLLAINPVHVFKTSLPYFLTIGHFFLLVSIYYFIRWQKDKKYLIPLTLSSLALLLSHHLSNYMYIISIVGMSFLLAAYGKIDVKKAKQNYMFITIFSAITFTYWIVRVPGMINFVEAPFRYLIPWYLEIPLFFVVLSAVFYLSLKIKLKRTGKFVRVLENLQISHVFVLSLALGTLILVLLVVVGLRGKDVPFVSFVYSIPFLLTMGFMGVGLSKLYKNENLLYYIGGWLGAITISLIVGLITWSSIEPWRHIEYMMEPLSIAGALGIAEVFKSDAFEKVSIKKRIRYTLNAPLYVLIQHFPYEINMASSSVLRISNGESVHEPFEYKEIFHVGKNMKIIFTTIVIFILIMTGIMAFPFMNNISPPRQEVSYVVMSGIEWLAENGNKNYTVATDHKIGTILAAYHFNSSFEYDYQIWNATNWQACIWELQGLNGTYPKVGYVVISKDMREYGVYGYDNLENPVGPPVMMSNASYEKFKHEPFELIFENHTENYDDWVEIYSVNWTYIYQNLNNTPMLKSTVKNSPEPANATGFSTMQTAKSESTYSKNSREQKY